MPSRSHSHTSVPDHRGVVIVEVAILFPLFMLVIFAFIAGITSKNAYYALHQSVGYTRQAITRGDVQRVGRDDMIQAVRAWKDSGGSNSAGIHSLLVHGVPVGLFSNYDTMANSVFGVGCPTVNLIDLPDSYIYALIYASQTMLASVGGAEVKFPCDPTGTGPNDGEGCLQCTLMHSSSESVTYAGPVDGPPFCSANYDLNWVGIQCRHKLGGGVLGPVIRLVDFMTPSSVSNNFVLTAQNITSSPVN
ncbi:MAG: hypothetical protein KDD44_02640 [Bdellovibrionales bacterium]|nr:hypothetical protein [Bdellovibrionales bacterium]